MTTTFRILVVSDIHMIDAEPSVNSSSWVSSRPRFSGPSNNPLSALKNIVSSSDEIDWLLCPGDLADKHNETCQGVAWQKLHSIKDELHIRHFFGTVGNHDVDSRHVVERTTLPSSAIKSLEPSFPHSSDTNGVLHNDFWANGVTQFVETERDISLIILNSSIFHGIDSGSIDSDGRLNDQEWNRGKIPPETVDRFKNLVATTRTNRNVVMLHHHVHASPYLPTDNSVLENSEEILSALEASQKDWLTLHGHLHIPRIYRSGNRKMLNILSSGSAGGKTWQGTNAITPNNQVHLIEFNDSAKLKARILSWSWINNEGWIPAENSRFHGLPSKAGIGSETSVVTLAGLVRDYVNLAGEVEWSELEDRFEDLNYMLPDEIEDFYEILRGDELKILLNDKTKLPELLKGAPNE